MRKVEPVELYEQQNDCQLIDVRSPAEYQREHLPGSVNIPLGDLESALGEISKDARVVLVCASGNRAAQACRRLEEHGIETEVLEGGLKAWNGIGLPVRKGQAGGVSLERQVRVVAGALAGIGGALALTVHPYWAALPTFVGFGLIFAGVTDTCGMAMLLARLPYNRRRSCDSCR